MTTKEGEMDNNEDHVNFLSFIVFYVFLNLWIFLPFLCSFCGFVEDVRDVLDFLDLCHINLGSFTVLSFLFPLHIEDNAYFKCGGRFNCFICFMCLNNVDICLEMFM